MKKDTKSRNKGNKHNKSSHLASPPSLTKKPKKNLPGTKLAPAQKASDQGGKRKKTKVKVALEPIESNLAPVDPIVPLELEPFPESERTPRLWKWVASLLVLSAFVVSGFSYEIRNSHFQSKTFYNLSKDIKFTLEEGKGDIIQAPLGPYDIRLGYSNINQYVKNLESNSFKQNFHTRVSKEGLSLLKYDLNIPYNEKAQSGLSIKAYDGTNLNVFKEPTWIFPNLETLSPYIINTLLFIEDRNLLSPVKTHHNPAVEWDRFLKASSDLVLKKVFGNRDVPGGSTLATQI